MGKGRPQQQEQARSGHTPVTQEDWQAAGVVEGEELRRKGRRGPVPPANRQGRHPPKEQDKPKALGGAGHFEAPEDEE